MKKILLFFLLLVFISLKSQVYNAGTKFTIYKDIVPDSLLYYTVFPYSDRSYTISLFDDPLAAVRISAHGAVSSGGTAAYISILSLNHNVAIRLGRLDSVLVPAYNFWNVTKVALPLNKGDVINDPKAIWDTTLLYLTDHTGYGGGVKDVNDFIGGDKYIGLKYQTSSTSRYAWIRVQCVSKDSCYVKDYSYTTSALAIKKQEQSEIKIFPNPTTNAFYLKNVNSENFDISTITITDMLGNEVNFNCEAKTNDIRINLDRNLPEGYYLLRCVLKDQIIIKKFVKAAE